MRYLGIFLTMIMVTSCGVEAFVDPELKPYLEEYLALCEQSEACKQRKQRQVDLIEFSDDPNGRGDVIGYCGWKWSVDKEKQWYVKVIPKKNMGELQFKALMFHELGHCIHGLHHNETSQIMNADKTFSEYIYKMYWEWAMIDLFQTQMGSQP